MPEFDGEKRWTRDRLRHDREVLFPIRSILGVSFHFSANPRTQPHEAETCGKQRTCLFHPKNGKTRERRKQTRKSRTPTIALLPSIDTRNCEKNGTIGSPETADAAPLRARRRDSFYTWQMSRKHYRTRGREIQVSKSEFVRIATNHRNSAGASGRESRAAQKTCQCEKP